MSKEIHPEALKVLYPENLYRVPEGPPAGQPDLGFRGTNLKGISIVINNPEGSDLRFELNKLLLKILESVGLNENDVAIVDSEEPGLSIDSLKNQLEAKLCIVFGNIPLFVELAENQIQSIDGLDILKTSSLAELDVDTAKKRALWEALKLVKEKI